MSDQNEIIINFTLEEFEGWVFSANFSEAEWALGKIIEHMANNIALHCSGTGRVVTVCSSSPGIPNGRKESFAEGSLYPMGCRETTYNQRIEYYNRLASAITALLVNRNYDMSVTFFRQLLFYKNHLADIFVCSSYGSMDHILRIIGILDKKNQLHMQGAPFELNRLLICYSLESEFDFDFEILFDLVPDYAVHSYFGMIYASNKVVTEVANERKNNLLNNADWLKNSKAMDHVISSISNPWMLVSYADTNKRHEAKVWFNDLISRWLADNGFSSNTRRKKRSADQKPVMVVAVEAMSPGHAMYRCYIKRLEALREDYTTVLVTKEKNLEGDVASHFDFVEPLYSKKCNKKAVGLAINAILKYEPDVLLYPSLGMDNWTVVLSNLRLAAVQVMSGGHPASSMSPEVDYMLLTGMAGDSHYYQEFCSEIVVVAEELDGIVFAPHSNMPAELPVKTLSDGVIRIAINSNLMKVSSRFLKVCKAIQDLASVPIEFHFFLGDRSVRADAFSRQVAKILANPVVYMPQSYPDYLASLVQCDISLGTFPFGGANTNIDLALLGIPKVMMRDMTDIAGDTDRTIWKEINLPDILYAENEMKYIATATALIHDSGRIKQISDQILAQHPREKYFRPEESHDSMLRAMRDIELLEKNKKSPKAQGAASKSQCGA